MKRAIAAASPSLALIKYWGKSDSNQNLPATSSLAVTLDSLCTTTTVSIADAEQVFINGQTAEIGRFHPFFENFRRATASSSRFCVNSETNFPIAAGLASSSSGFAALALACAKLTAPSISMQEISALARMGSASAARSLFGGFTVLKRETPYAEPLNLEWPELRIIIAIVESQAKQVSSRVAMELSRATSPFYPAWLEESEALFSQGLQAARKKDLKILGPLVRQSYLSMFSTMLTSSPPIIYWKPESVALIHACEAFRQRGTELWETMDAGPQVKMLCLENDLEAILKGLKREHPGVQFLVAKPGGAPQS